MVTFEGTSVDELEAASAEAVAIMGHYTNENEDHYGEKSQILTQILKVS